jgi:hypothetical protein
MSLCTNEGASVARPISCRSPSEFLRELTSQGRAVGGSRQGAFNAATAAAIEFDPQPPSKETDGPLATTGAMK